MISKWAEVKPMLTEKDTDVICLQETHFLPTDQYDFRLHNYTIFNAYANTDRRQGGVCIYVKNDHPHFQKTLNTTLQAVACSVKVGRTRLCVCSLYLPPAEPITFQDINNLICQLPQPFVICTDANSRHTMWGADRCDPRGIIWERIIQQHALHILNDGCPTRLDEYTGLWSHIDITISTHNIGQYLTWCTDNDLYSSDHCPIQITYDIQQTAQDRPNMFYGWNTNKAKWVEFTDICNIQFDEAIGINNCKNITENLITAATETISKKTGKTKYSCPWWNDDCKEAIQNRKRTLNRLRRSNRTEHLMQYKQAKAKARQVVRKAKKDSWEKLLHIFNHTTPIKQLWEIIRKFTKKDKFVKRQPVLRINDDIIDDPQEVANKLGHYYSEISASENYRPIFREHLNEIINNTLSKKSNNPNNCFLMF